MTSYAEECTRVYLPYGKLAHLKAPYNTLTALCLRTPGWRGEWLGSGSQKEIDHAASLPLCRICESSANIPTVKPDREVA